MPGWRRHGDSAAAANVATGEPIAGGDHERERAWAAAVRTPSSVNSGRTRPPASSVAATIELVVARATRKGIEVRASRVRRSHAGVMDQGWDRGMALADGARSDISARGRRSRTSAPADELADGALADGARRRGSRGQRSRGRPRRGLGRSHGRIGARQSTALAREGIGDTIGKGEGIRERITVARLGTRTRGRKGRGPTDGRTDAECRTKMRSYFYSF